MYSIVCHDTANKKIIPIVEWFTNSHTASNLAKYLYIVKKAIQTNTHYIHKSSEKKMNFTLPRLLVVDFSWPLINSVMEIFNNCTISDYLKWTFDVLVNKTTEPYLIYRNNLF